MADDVNGGGTPPGECPEFGYDAGRAEDGPGGPPPPCPECGGSGELVPLTGSTPCARCGGTGRDAAAPAAPEVEPGDAWDWSATLNTGPDEDGLVTQMTFDRHGRLVRITDRWLPASAPPGPGGDAAGGPPPAG